MATTVLLHCFAYGHDYLRDMVADLTPAQMVAQPAGIRNHPAWVIGHLTVTCQQLGGALGLSPWLPSDAETRYCTGSLPVAELHAYPGKQESLAKLTDAQQRLTVAVAGLTPAQLSAPFPDEAYRHVFPTLSHALTQVLVGHAAYHLGQLALWRKGMGLPALTRPFE